LKKFLARAERALVALVLNPQYRPFEHELAVKVAKSVAIRWGLSSAALTLVLEVLDRVLS
jgi:hypothetical protein